MGKNKLESYININETIDSRSSKFYGKIEDKLLYSLEDFNQEIWITILENKNNEVAYDITSAIVDTINRLNKIKKD